MNYCIDKKGLIVRDFKKFVAKKIINRIENEPESRKVWLLRKFEFAGKRLNRISKYKFWKDDNHAILLEPNQIKIIDQKLNYIHDNPVRALIVQNPADYIFSSAKDYSGETGFVKVVLLH